MCGRFGLYSPPQRIQEHFETSNCFEFVPRYNLTPQQSVPVIQAADGERFMTSAQWGLIPSWVKDPKELSHPINARAETAAVRPMFRHAFRKSRVLVPADCFYEWQQTKSGKQPYLIRSNKDHPFAMAGLLEHWHGPVGIVSTFTILTTQANTFMSSIHDRMPVIIANDDYGAWLDPELTDPKVIQSYCKPSPENALEAWPISTKINSPANDGADLTKKIHIEMNG